MRQRFEELKRKQKIRMEEDRKKEIEALKEMDRVFERAGYIIELIDKYL
jgi:hypothetical protein